MIPNDEIRITITKDMIQWEKILQLMKRFGGFRLNISKSTGAILNVYWDRDIYKGREEGAKK